MHPRQSFRKIVERVHYYSVLVHLIVQVGAGGGPGVAYVRDGFSPGHFLPRFYLYRYAMCIGGLEPVSVVDYDYSSVPVLISCESDYAIGGRFNGSPVSCGDIDPRMEISFPRHRVRSPAESRGYFSSYRPDIRLRSQIGDHPGCILLKVFAVLFQAGDLALEILRAIGKERKSSPEVTDTSGASRREDYVPLSRGSDACFGLRQVLGDNAFALEHLASLTLEQFCLPQSLTELAVLLLKLQNLLALRLSHVLEVMKLRQFLLGQDVGSNEVAQCPEGKQKAGKNGHNRTESNAGAPGISVTVNQEKSDPPLAAALRLL